MSSYSLLSSSTAIILSMINHYSHSYSYFHSTSDSIESKLKESSSILYISITHSPSLSRYAFSDGNDRMTIIDENHRVTIIDENHRVTIID